MATILAPYFSRARRDVLSLIRCFSATTLDRKGKVSGLRSPLYPSRTPQDRRSPLNPYPRTHVNLPLQVESLSKKIFAAAVFFCLPPPLCRFSPCLCSLTVKNPDTACWRVAFAVSRSLWKLLMSSIVLIIINSSFGYIDYLKRPTKNTLC